MSKFIIVCTSESGNRYVQTRRGHWIHSMPAVNDGMWQQFNTKSEAEKELIEIQKVQGFSYRIENF